MLPLKCLVYLFEKHPNIARHLYATREIRISQRGEFANYPFACAGITLVKTLCGIFQICNPLTGNIINIDYNTSYSTCWQLIKTKQLFYELFVWSFLVLDKVWDESNATYMDFGNVLKIVSSRINNVLLNEIGGNENVVACLSTNIE
jgi:hypothetical protein